MGNQDDEGSGARLGRIDARLREFPDQVVERGPAIRIRRRLPARARLPDLDVGILAWTADVGGKGAFIATCNPPVPVGVRVELELWGPDLRLPAQARGYVARVSSDPAAPGFAVELVWISAEWQWLLDALGQ